MSRESDAVRDLAHAPLGYIEDALKRSREAVEKLEDELLKLEANNLSMRKFMQSLTPMHSHATTETTKTLFDVYLEEARTS